METMSLDKIKEAAMDELGSAINKVVPQLEELSKENLLELVKVISLVRTAEALQVNQEATAPKELDTLIDNIMNLQEIVVGVTQLNHDLQTGVHNEQ